MSLARLSDGFQSLPPCYPQANWALLVLLPSWVICVHSRPLWVSPSNSPVRLGVSPAAASTPTGVFTQRFEALFPRTGAMGCVVCFAPLQFLPVYLCVPPGLSMCECGATGSISHHLVGSTSRCTSSPPQLPISAPPTGLDECFFFISLVVRLPYSLIFCQFWLFFVFKLLLSFWLCKEAQCVYLRLHLGLNLISDWF